MNLRSTGALSGALCALFLVLMAGWPLASSAQHTYEIDAVPSPTGQPVVVVLSSRTVSFLEVKARIAARNAAGEVGAGAREITVPRGGFVRLNNADLALGFETGPRTIHISSDYELNVTAMRGIWGDRAVSLPVYESHTPARGAVALGYTRHGGDLGLVWGMSWNQRGVSTVEITAARSACGANINGPGSRVHTNVREKTGCYRTIRFRECLSVVSATNPSQPSDVLWITAHGATQELADDVAVDRCYNVARGRGFTNPREEHPIFGHQEILSAGCGIVVSICNDRNARPTAIGSFYSSRLRRNVTLPTTVSQASASPVEAAALVAASPVESSPVLGAILAPMEDTQAEE